MKLLIYVYLVRGVFGSCVSLHSICISFLIWVKFHLWECTLAFVKVLDLLMFGQNGDVSSIQWAIMLVFDMLIEYGRLFFFCHYVLSGAHSVSILYSLKVISMCIMFHTLHVSMHLMLKTTFLSILLIQGWIIHIMYFP